MTSTRRELLRKSATAAGVAGVAWAAPRVEGLSLRPDYAQAQSGPTCASYALALNRAGDNIFNYTYAGSAAGPGSATVNATGTPAAPSIGLTSVVMDVSTDGSSTCVLTVDGIDNDRNFSFLQNGATTYTLRGAFGSPNPLVINGNICCD